jgi:CBS domain-containing protein
MRCSEVMKPNPVCLDGTEPAHKAARMMRDANIGFLPVRDSTGRVTGTVTDRDIAIRFLADQLPGDTEVSAIATKDAVACRPDDDMGRALELMERHRVSRIMCIDEQGKLVGVISLSDIAQRSDMSTTFRQIKSNETFV